MGSCIQKLMSGHWVAMKGLSGDRSSPAIDRLKRLECEFLPRAPESNASLCWTVVDRKPFRQAQGYHFSEIHVLYLRIW